jgi:tetratricopeptide (TPR) repeat protein
MLKLILFLLLCVSCSGCFPDTYGGMKDFQEKISAAERAFKVEDYRKAEQYYLSAGEIAEKINWNGGVVTAKQGLASLYSVEKKYKEAESLLIAAKQVCRNDSNCSGLDSIYDDLMFLYLFDLKEIKLAQNTVEEIILLKKEFPQDKKNKYDIRKYAGEMKTAGFEKESNDLIILLSSNK